MKFPWQRPKPDTEKIHRAARTDLVYHEAAHAVISWKLGLEVTSVTTDDSTLSPSQKAAGLAAATAHKMGTARENAIVSLVGLMASDIVQEQMGVEFKYEGVGEGYAGHNDEQHAKLWAMCEAGAGLKSTQEERNRGAEALSRWVTEAHELLIACWVAVAAVAKALDERGTLDAAALTAILGPLPEVGPEVVAARESDATKAKELGLVVQA